jgi:hypothetical protein
MEFVEGETLESLMFVVLRPNRPKIAAQSGCSLCFPFVFLLDFLFVVLDIERNLGKKAKKICVTRVANLISEIVIGYPMSFGQTPCSMRNP